MKKLTFMLAIGVACACGLLLAARLEQKKPKAAKNRNLKLHAAGFDINAVQLEHYRRSLSN